MTILSPFPHSKLLHPDDYQRPELQHHLAFVDKWSRDLQHQHEHRRWEYAMALRALADWEHYRGLATQHVQLARPLLCYDVGGAGSPFTQMLAAKASAVLYDPAINAELKPFTHAADAIFCISVLEHIREEEWRTVIGAMLTSLRAGGLLFITMDCLPPLSLEDKAHFNWMRKSFMAPEIAGENDWTGYGATLQPFGPVDFTWTGCHVYDYNFISFAFLKH